MKTKKVNDLMIPLSEYATVSQDATLKEAVLALEEAQKQFDSERGHHRGLMVFNEQDYIVGKISQLDILRALEPNYDQVGDSESVKRIGMSRLGLSPKFMRTMLEEFKLWDIPIDQLSQKAAELRVKDFMYTLTEGEIVDKNASLGEAIHQLVMGHHQSLLVTHRMDVVGILRLTDVFREICDIIKQ